MPNDDYIKRDEALFELYRDASVKDPMALISYRVDLCERIEKIPAVDVEPVWHGWWIPGDRFEYDGHGETVRHPGGITCSRCRYSFAEKHLWSRSYCPHCGAKMDAEPPKEEDDEE